MAVKDIVAGAEMFLRTAGIADEGMRRQLLQRIQEQALQKSQLEFQNEQGFQKYATEFTKPRMLEGVAPQENPEGFTEQRSMLSPEFVQGAMKFLTPSQGVTAATTLLTKESPQTEFLKKLYLQSHAASLREPSKANAYEDFRNGFIAEHPNAGPAEISKAWAAQTLEQLQNRYPPEQQGRSDLPPWIKFNRITGEYTDPAKNILSGDELKDAYVIQAGLKADSGSIRNQAKVADMMGGFVRNINKQIGRVEEIFADTIKRVGIRALDLPKREFDMAIKGSGHEKVLESYLAEISREIGKLSTGSSASIAELSVEAQKRWDKIHDPNLSLKELKLILDATREQANMRYQSSLEQINATQQRMGETPTKGNTPAPSPTTPQPSKFKILRVK